MTQRVFDVDNPKDMQDLFNLFPDDCNRIARDYNSSGFYLYDGRDMFAMEGPELWIEIAWHDKTEVHRPAEIKVGAFGFFWDEDTNAILGRLSDFSDKCYYPDGGSEWYTYFRPVTDEELCGLIGCKKIVR